MSEKIQLLHPEGKHQPTIDADKYEMMKNAFLKILKNKTLTHKDFFEQLHNELGEKFDGKVGWWGMAVKLDLEARGIIEKFDTKPMTIRLKK